MGISQEDKMNTMNRFASVAMMGVMVVMGASSQMWADQQTRFRARENKMINGFEAELRGDYRETHSPVRLNAELEKINLPAGTKVAFCLLHDGVKTLLGVSKVGVEGDVPVAELELNAEDGATVPNVEVGDVLQARQRTTAPFLARPNCGSTPLIAAPFAK
jgi:hypothetical protein